MNRQCFCSALSAMALAAGSVATLAFASFTSVSQAAVTAPVNQALAPQSAQTSSQAATDSGSMLPGLVNVGFQWSDYFKALAILCFVLAVLWAILWLVKRRGNSGLFASSTPSMRIESRLALGPKKWLMVVRYLDRRLVLGVTDKTISLVTELYDQDYGTETQSMDSALGKSLFQKKKKPLAKAQTMDQAPGIDSSQLSMKDVDSAVQDKDDLLSFASILKKDKSSQEPQ